MRSPRCMSGPPPGHRGRNGAAIMTPYGGVPPRRSHCTRHILFQTTTGCVWTWSGPGQRRPWAPLRAVPTTLRPVPSSLRIAPPATRRQSRADQPGAALCELERARFRLPPTGILRELVKTRQDFTSPSTGESGGHFRSRLPSTTLLSGSRRASRNGTPAIGPDLDWSSKGRVSICEARAVRRERGGQQMGCHREQSRVMQSDAVLSTGSSSQQPRHLLG
jgi:hypothetical protein